MSESPDSIWKVLSSCSVCGKQLDKDSGPQLLPCCHSSCKDCIEDNKNLLSDLTQNGNNTNSIEKPEFKCKICFQEYSPEECIDNYFQLNYLSRKKSIESQICQSCEGQNKSAVIKCKTCDWICEDCQTLHKTIKVFKGHELDETTKINDSEDIKNLCSLHNEEITVYCKTCRTPYCCRCILKDHNLHVYDDTKDSNQLNIFYNNLTKKVESIKEKRSFAENTLKKFETIETDISGQKEECIIKIKNIVKKLQEKVSELGTNLLDKINNVCQQKEEEFHQKKKQLRQMNDAFKFIEEFMAAILALNEPMSVMKAQDLINVQLEKLLNKPCSHPDFITPFKIQVKDTLSDGQTDGQTDGQGFDVGKMIDGVYNMCFKIETSDDPKEAVNSNGVRAIGGNTVDDEISIIGVTKSNTPPLRSNFHIIESSGQPGTRTAAKAQTFRPTAPAVSSVRSVLSTIIRGNSNRELSANVANSGQNHNHNHNHNHSYANPMQYYPGYKSNALSVTPQRSRNSQNSSLLANSVPTSHSISQNNLMPQTGIVSVPYGSPQVFRGPVANQMGSNQSNLPVRSSYLNNYLNQQTVAPNVSLTPNQMMRIGVGPNGIFRIPITQSSHINNQTIQSIGTTQPTVIRPTITTIANQQTPNMTPNMTIITQLNQTTNNILNQMNAQSQQTVHNQQRQQTGHNQQSQQTGHNQQNAQNQQTGHNQQSVRNQQIRQNQPLNQSLNNNSLEIQKQREIQRIEQDLRDSSSAFGSNPLGQRVIEILNTENLTQNLIPSLSQYQNNSINSTNTCASNGESHPIPDRSYELHILDNTTITPITSEPERRHSSAPLNSETSAPLNRVSGTSTPSPSISTQSTVQNTNVQTILVHSNEEIHKTTAPSVPIVSNVIQSTNVSEINKEKTPNQSGNAVQTNPNEETEELILPHVSSPASVDSDLFSELSGDPFPESSETNQTNNNKEENRENTTSGNRSTAPIARIAPITNESDNTSNLSNASNNISNSNTPEMIDLRDDSTDDEIIDEDADCVVCSKEYGEFICCSQCPRAFHCECHVPELKRMPETSFICTFCKSADDVPLSSRSRKSGLNDRQHRICEKVLLHLLCHKKSQDFKPPVSDNIQPNLNLNTIKKKLENKEFGTEIQFIDDLKRMVSRFKNRNITPEVMEDYNTFERYFKKIIHKLMPSFSEALQNNTSINNFDSSGGSAPKKSKSNCVSI